MHDVVQKGPDTDRDEGGAKEHLRVGGAAGERERERERKRVGKIEMVMRYGQTQRVCLCVCVCACVVAVFTNGARHGGTGARNLRACVPPSPDYSRTRHSSVEGTRGGGDEHTAPL